MRIDGVYFNLEQTKWLKKFIKIILEEDINNIKFDVYRKVEAKVVTVMKISDFIEKFKKKSGPKLTDKPIQFSEHIVGFN